ncbi:regulator of chromosome condensation 1/beta-lactamase-inhibitor protein II [Zopfochytrium polystomum]|nr:regulator of chromosome condensation 1/beta-lactamase-inhibitor protein II [Zopfochytrium polystomum]
MRRFRSATTTAASTLLTSSPSLSPSLALGASSSSSVTSQSSCWARSSWKQASGGQTGRCSPLHLHRIPVAMKPHSLPTQPTSRRAPTPTMMSQHRSFATTPPSPPPPLPRTQQVKADPSSTMPPSHRPSDPHPAFEELRQANSPTWRILSLAVAVAVASYTFAVAVHNEGQAASEAGSFMSQQNDQIKQGGGGAGKGGLQVTSVDADVMTEQAEIVQSRVGVWVWGSNAGRVGDPSEQENTVFRQPHFVKAFSGTPLRDLKVAKTHAAAIDAKGNLLQYGSSIHAVGNGNSDLTPMKTVTNKDLVQLAVTPSSVIALTRTGTVLFVPAAPPASVMSPSAVTKNVPFANGVKPEKITSVAAGNHHVIALGASGRVYTCALDAAGDQFGQLGHGQPIPLGKEAGANVVADEDLLVLRPVVAGGLESVKVAQVAAGSKFSVVRTANGTAFTWGANHLGQLGRGKPVTAETAASSVPEEVQTLWHRTAIRPQPPDARVTNIAAAGETAYYVIDTPSSTEVYAAGNGQWGQLGNGSYQHAAHRPAPIAALSNLRAYSESAKKTLPIRVGLLAASPTHAVAVLDAGAAEAAAPKQGGRSACLMGDVVSWGLNDKSQLYRGDGRRGSAPAPSWVGALVPRWTDAGAAADAEGVADGQAGAQAAEAAAAAARPTFWDALGLVLTGRRAELPAPPTAAPAVPWEASETAALLGRMQAVLRPSRQGWAGWLLGSGGGGGGVAAHGFALADGVTIMYARVSA